MILRNWWKFRKKIIHLTFFFFYIGFILQKMLSADWLVWQKKNMNSCRFSNTKD